MRTEADNLAISDEPIPGMVLHDFERLIWGTLKLGYGASSTSGGRHWSGRGVRHYVPEEEGEGYYDFFNLSEWLNISVTDATYVEDKWIRVAGDGFFKIRLLLSGTLLTRAMEPLVRSPQLSLTVVPASASEGYFIKGGENLSMVVLHCRPELISRTVGLGEADVPPPFDILFDAGAEAQELQFNLSRELMHTARKIINSRHLIYSAIRGQYLNTLSMDILIEVLNECHALAASGVPENIPRRDLHKIIEAQDYIQQNFDKPLSITQIARLVGINQTKLKLLFRIISGETVYGYILRCRMEKAAELLHGGQRGVAEIGYAVGYSYPANFASAFRKHYGVTPSTYTHAR